MVSLLDLLGECRGEHQRLSLADGRHARALHDAPDLWLEAHVEHSVCLVQHQVAALHQPNLPALDQVHQPPRCRDEQLEGRGVDGRLR